MDQKDEDLITEFQQGNLAAFDALFGRYKKQIFNFSLRLLNNRADAEDATSEVFMKLFEKKNYYQPTNAKFSTWLFTIAYNVCISKIRSRKSTASLWFRRNNDTEETPLDIPDQTPSTPEKLMTLENILMIQRAIDKLPEKQKEALILREYNQFSYQEIAQIMTCSIDQVKILIFRAREFLRDNTPHLKAEGQNG